MPISDLSVLSARMGYRDTACRTISWSKNGFICYASPASQGHNLNMTFLENTNGSHWQLAASHKMTIKPLQSSIVPDLQLVLWSTVLTDLAIFDEFGNFYILLAGVGLLRQPDAKREHSQSSFISNPIPEKTNNAANDHLPVPSGDSSDENEGPSYELTSYNHAEMIYRDIISAEPKGSKHIKCVAFEWLGINKPRIINKSAKLTDDGSSYTYGVHLHQPNLASHPITTKQACISLREDGLVTLYHQGEHKVEYHKLTARLMADGLENELYITHASFGFARDKKILLTAYSAISRKILTFSISVDWGYLVESAARQKTEPHYCTPEGKQSPPTISISLLHEMSVLPQVVAEGVGRKGDSCFWQYNISMIDILSPYHEPLSAPDVLITYEVISPDDQVSSVIHRFRLLEASNLLNGQFSMPSGSAPAEGDLYSLVLQDKLSIPKRLKAIRLAISDLLVILIFEDGTINVIDRTKWSLITEENRSQMDLETIPRPTSIDSLLDCNYRIPRLQNNSEPFLFALSPNLAGIFHLRVKSSEAPTLVLLDSGSGFSDMKVLSASFSHSHAHACYSNTTSDDIMALIQSECDKIPEPEKRREFTENILRESHSAINFYLNSFNKESVDKLLSNPPLQKLLSLQLALSDSCGSKLSGDIAWIVLSLRSTSFGIMFTLSSIYRQMSKKKPMDDSMDDSINRAECIILLIGSVKWFIDLLIYLNQELLQLSLAASHPGKSAINLKNSIVLPLLMSKVPRLFLMYAITSIGKTHEILKKLHKDLSQSNKLFTPMKEALEWFFNTSNYLPLKLSNFETFVRDCDDYITKETISKWADRSALLDAEQQLFCRGVIPEDMLNIAQAIVERFTSKYSRDPRVSAIYFYNSQWLQIGATHHNTLGRHKFIEGLVAQTHARLQFSDTIAVDALRKVFMLCYSPIQSGGITTMGQYQNSTYTLKKCVRCRSVSSVTDPLVFDSPKTIGLWTMVFQRNCICGSAWVNCLAVLNL